MKKLLVLSAIALFITGSLFGQEKEEKKHVKIITINNDGKKIVREYENGEEDVIEWATQDDDAVKIILHKGGEEEEIIIGNMPTQMKWHMTRSGGNKAFLGVYLADEQNDQGVNISGVVDKSAAEEAGMEKGDVIVAINDAKVTDNESLLKALEGMEPGDKVQITFLRDDTKRTENVELGSREEDFEFMIPDFEKEVMIELNEEGMHYKEMYDEDRAFLGIEPAENVADVTGVMIKQTTKNSAAQTAGLQTGDVITEIAGNSIANFEDLKKALEAKNPGDEIEVKYTRQGKKKTAKVTLTSMADVMKNGNQRVIIKEIEED